MLDAHGRTEAAVLIPVLGWPSQPRLVFTERRHDLNRHAGEISFPGGRRDPGETLVEAAIREAHEEIELPPHEIDVVGALPPIGTFVTSFKVHPFVALIGDPPPPLRPNPAEVAGILEFGIDELRDSYGERRLIRQGVPFRTPTYTLGDTLIWGATARILGELLDRIDG